MSKRSFGVMMVFVLLAGLGLLRSRPPVTVNAPAVVPAAPVAPTAVGVCGRAACDEKPAARVTPEAVKTTTAVAPAVSPAVSVSKRLRPLEKSMPDLQRVREEVARNPHETSQALLEFSVVLGKRLEGALKSEPAAREFFPELQACALSAPESSLASARGLCLVNARRLARRFPVLQRDFNDLSAQADAESVRLARQLVE